MPAIPHACQHTCSTSSVFVVDGFLPIAWHRGSPRGLGAAVLPGVDGAFFMCFEDWVHYFTNVSVCPVGTAPIEEDGEMEEGSDEEDEYEDVDDGP